MGIITNETLINHLHCRRKAFLKAAGTPGELHDIERVRIDLDGAYIQRALEVYLARYDEREIVRSPPSLEAAIRSGPRVIVDATATADNVRSLIQLMERVEDGGGKGPPSMPVPHVALYLDVEGVPDRNSYYLIGLLAVEEGRSTSFSFWADDSTQEKAIWQACAEVIEGFADYTVYHYGRYEQGFLDRMKRSADDSEAAVIDRIRSKSCNVLAVIYSHFYFPTHSNSLKDIGKLLGAGWSADDASGIQSLAWRLTWESRHDEALKQQLLAPTPTTSVKRSTSAPARPSARACGVSNVSAKGLLGSTSASNVTHRSVVQSASAARFASSNAGHTIRRSMI